ncbi:MAG: sigma-70 family RNA polymerase sigma factor [Planctomycetota bacterium]
MSRPLRPDADLLFARFQSSGDPDALAAVYDLTCVPLLRAATRCVADLATAEDVLHETFVIAIARADRYQPDRPVIAWLLAILHNEARRVRGERTRRRTLPLADEDQPTADKGPCVAAAQNESVARARTAIDALPEPYRAVVRLRWLHALSHAAIAEILDRPVGTVRMQAMRGLLLLRRALPVGIIGGLVLQALPAGARPPGLLRIRRDLRVRARQHRRPARPDPLRPRRLASTFLVGTIAVVGAIVAPSLFSLGAPPPVGGHRSPKPPPGTDAAALVRSSTPARVAVAQDMGREREAATLTVNVRDRSDDPVPGAWLRLRHLATAQPFISERWLRADASGRIAVSGLADGPWRVSAARGGSATVELRPGRSRETTVTIPPGYALRGAVVDDAGQPVAHPRIWLSNVDDDRSGHEVVSGDATGSFAIEAVSGARFVGARADGFAAGCVVRIAARPDDVVDVRLIVPRAHGRVVGSVHGPHGPVLNALIQVGRGTTLRGVVLPDGRNALESPPIAARTDRLGRFDIGGVPVGKTTVVAWSEGLLSGATGVTIESAGVATCALQLTRASVRGQVRGPDGSPVAGARVGCWDLTKSTRGAGVRSDAKGRYCITTFATRFPTLWATHPAHGTASQGLQLDDANPHQTWDAVLQHGPSPIRGALLDPRDRPLAGWTIQVRQVPPASVDGPPSAITGADGGFVLPRAPGTQQFLVVMPPDVLCPCGPVVAVTSEEAQVLRLTPAWMPTASIRGRVIDTGGDPVPGVHAALTRRRWVARTNLDADHVWVPIADDGTFHRDGLPPGDYDLAVSAAGFAPRTIQNIRLDAERAVDVGVVTLEPRPDPVR